MCKKNQVLLQPQACDHKEDSNDWLDRRSPEQVGRVCGDGEGSEVEGARRRE